MAEYYPLLSRAVAGLRDASPDQRRAIYDRARQALLGQLRSMQPAVPEDAIERESEALDQSIARLEGEIVSVGDTPPAEPSPIPAGPAATDLQRPVEEPKAADAPPQPAPSAAEPSAASPGPGRATASGPAKRPATAAAARATKTSPRPTAPRAAFGAASRASAAGAQEPRPATPSLRASRGGDDAAASPPLPSAPRLQVAARAKEPAESQTAPEQASTVPDGWLAEGPDASPATVVKEEVLRPAAPRPVLRKPFNPRLIIVAAVAALVVAGIAYTAWRLRDKPEALARSRAALAAAHPAEPQAGKVVTRADQTAAAPPAAADSSAAPPAPTPPPAPVTPAPAPAVQAPAEAPPAAAPQPATAAAPSAEQPTAAAQSSPPAAAPLATAPPAAQDTARQTPAPPATAVPTPDATPATASPPATAAADTVTPAPEPAAVPVAQRAALLVDAPDDPKKVKTYVGTVVWRAESVSPGQGQPLGTAVRAEVEVPEADLTLSMLFQKNSEPQFPASHTMELRFTPTANNTLGNVKQINVPQMRKDDSPTGDPLIGLPVTITENYFLVGLSRGEAVTRNLDLIKTRNWIDIPLLLVSGKVAKITFEKGAVGDQVINSAIQSWQ